MTYMPHPAGASWLTEPPPRPRSVVAAVQLIYASAALEVLGVIIAVARIGTVTSAFEARGFTASQAHGLAMNDSHMSVASRCLAVLPRCLAVPRPAAVLLI